MRLAKVIALFGNAVLQTWVGVVNGWPTFAVVLVVLSWLALPTLLLKPRQ